MRLLQDHNPTSDIIRKDAKDILKNNTKQRRIDEMTQHVESSLVLEDDGYIFTSRGKNLVKKRV